MNKKRSIYEFILENIDLEGKLAMSVSLNIYLESIGKKELVEEDEFDMLKNMQSDFWDNIDSMVNPKDEDHIKVDFTFGNLISKTLDTKDVKELEEYLEKKPLDVGDIDGVYRDKIKEIIEPKDNNEMVEFLMENIKNTTNPYALNFYLYFLSYLNLEEDNDIKKCILRIALMKEYTKTVNKYLIDKFEYPDYIRFFLVKRVAEVQDKVNLLLEMNTLSNEVKLWILKRIGKALTYESFDLIKRMDIKNIMTKWEMNEELFELVSAFFATIVSNYRKEEIDNIAEMLEIYIDLAKDYLDNDNVIDSIAQICSCYNDPIHSYGVNDIEKFNKEKEIITNFVMSELFFEKLSEKVVDGEKINFNVLELVRKLNLKEFDFKILNKIKENPLANIYYLTVLEHNKELYLMAADIIDNSINWEEYYGPLQNDEGKMFSKPEMFVMHCDGDLNLLARIAQKALKCKSSSIRQEVCYAMRKTLFKNDIDHIALFPEELRYLLQDHLKVEPNTKIRNEIKEILGMREYDEQADKMMSKFNFSSDTLENLEKEEFEEENKPLNLKDKDLAWNLGLGVIGKCVGYVRDKRCQYVGELQDEIIFFATENEFGKEYTIKLRKDKNYNLKEAICTCGKTNGKEYCNHILAALIMLGKKNEDEAKAKEKEVE